MCPRNHAFLVFFTADQKSTSFFSFWSVFNFWSPWTKTQFSATSHPLVSYGFHFKPFVPKMFSNGDLQEISWTVLWQIIHFGELAASKHRLRSYCCLKTLLDTGFSFPLCKKWMVLTLISNRGISEAKKGWGQLVWAVQMHNIYIYPFQDKAYFFCLFVSSPSWSSWWSSYLRRRLCWTPTTPTTATMPAAQTTSRPTKVCTWELALNIDYQYYPPHYHNPLKWLIIVWNYADPAKADYGNHSY